MSIPYSDPKSHPPKSSGLATELGSDSPHHFEVSSAIGQPKLLASVSQAVLVTTCDKRFFALLPNKWPQGDETNYLLERHLHICRVTLRTLTVRSG